MSKWGYLGDGFGVVSVIWITYGFERMDFVVILEPKHELFTERPSENVPLQIMRHCDQLSKFPGFVTVTQYVCRS